MKFLWYEDMKADQMKVIEELCTFLEHPLTDKQKRKLIEHVQFENMRTNPFSSPIPSCVLDQSKFFRKGLVGDWKNYFDKSGVEKWNTWIQSNINEDNVEDFRHLL